MAVFEAFEHDLRDTLAHLYDPTYQPPPLLWEVTGRDPEQGIQSLKASRIQEIENLKPDPNVPLNARIRLIYDVLSCRYLQGLTQEEAAKCVGITPRTLRRVQQQGVHLLAQRLWERSRSKEPAVPDDSPPEKEIPPSPVDDATEWHAQQKKELASLQESARGLVTDIEGIIQRTIEVSRALTSKHGVSLKAVSLEPDLLTTAQTSILRPILIRAIDKLVQQISPGGDIVLSTVEEGERIKITITGYPTTTEVTPDSDFIREALSTQHGSFVVQMEDEKITCQVTLPSASKVTVLVVDDNTDLVHFYRRYVAGTRYEIVHLAEGQHLFEEISDSRPDIIVLDVMLPGIDGWELLTHLHERSDTRSIPVLVCSVVRGEEMALALGAALYLQKPVRSRQFIEALDQVLSQARREASRAAPNTATTG